MFIRRRAPCAERIVIQHGLLALRKGLAHRLAHQQRQIKLAGKDRGGLVEHSLLDLHRHHMRHTGGGKGLARHPRMASADKDQLGHRCPRHLQQLAQRIGAEGVGHPGFALKGQKVGRAMPAIVQDLAADAEQLLQIGHCGDHLAQQHRAAATAPGLVEAVVQALALLLHIQQVNRVALAVFFVNQRGRPQHPHARQWRRVAVKLVIARGRHARQIAPIRQRALTPRPTQQQIQLLAIFEPHNDGLNRRNFGRLLRDQRFGIKAKLEAKRLQLVVAKALRNQVAQVGSLLGC